MKHTEDNIPFVDNNDNDNKKITYGEIKKIMKEHFKDNPNIENQNRFDFIQELIYKLAHHANNANSVQNSEIDANIPKGQDRPKGQEMEQVQQNSKRDAFYERYNKPLPDPAQNLESSSEGPEQIPNPTNEPNNDKAESKERIKNLGKEKPNEDYYIKEIKSLKKEIKTLKDEKDGYVKEIKSLKDKSDREIKSLKHECDKHKTDYNKLLTDYNNNVVRFNNALANWRENCDHLNEQLNNKRKEYNELSQKNDALREEASQYQSALGDAKNYRLGDNDANNPTQLTKDIEIIQDSISIFCKLKGGVDINEQQLTVLLEQYKCNIEEPGDKVLLKAALQRYIIETIIKKTEEYLKKELTPDEKNKHIELEVINSTFNYLTTIKQLIYTRKGTDEVSTAAPTKIKQLVTAVLGDRGFCLDNDGKEHEFVQELKIEIIKIMNGLRTIKKDDKRKENEELAAEIIRNVIKMFIFRIKVLEPPGEIEWIDKGAKIDPTTMEIGNLEDDDHEDYTVNLCSFPLIGVSLNSEKDRKVLVPAKIIAIKPPKAEQTTISNKLKKWF